MRMISKSGQYSQGFILCFVICVGSGMLTNISEANSFELNSSKTKFSGINNTEAANENKDAVTQEYWSIQFENDFFSRSGDRYYTHGTEISRTLMGQPGQWLKDLATFFPVFESDGALEGVNYSIGQKIFTPDDIQTSALVVNDRPYAGYLYFSATMLSRVSRKNNLDVGNLMEFTIGIVGPGAQAEEVQSSYHDLISIDRANGWDNQLQDELGIGLSYTRFWRYIKPLGSLDYGMTPHANLVFGNVYTYAASGIMFRYGTHLNNDLAPPNIRPGFPGLSLFKPNRQNNWYLFAGIEGRAVARNIFLDGNTFRESHSVNKKSLVADFQYGVVFQTGNMRFSISNMIRSKEFEGQKDKTNFGAVNFSFVL